MDTALSEKISTIAADKNALILAHNYQPESIQNIAHYVGDSLELSRIARDSDAELIVFCGVHFMAESAAILSPEKKVLLPASDAGCPMADMLTAEDIHRMREQYPVAQVVTYINSTAECKAESDYICTSSNAIKVVNSVEASEVIFAPDKNLGSWVAAHTSKKIHLFEGFCPVHALVPVDDVVRVKSNHPGAILMVHPECPPSVRDIADEVLSTGEMIRFASSAKFDKIIVGTEEGMLHALRRVNPRTEFISASDLLYCKNMKKTTLEHVLRALETEEPVVKVDSLVADRARRALERMHQVSM